MNEVRTRRILRRLVTFPRRSVVVGRGLPIHIGPRRPVCVRLVLLAVLGVSACGGCANYNWITDDYPQAAKLARENNKYLFIYYRWWMSPECGSVERDVLEHPNISKLFKNSVNCWLHQEWQENQAVMEQRFGVREVPSFVIVPPDGKFHKRSGVPSVAQLERWIQQAMPPPVTTGPNKR